MPVNKVSQNREPGARPGAHNPAGKFPQEPFEKVALKTLVAKELHTGRQSADTSVFLSKKEQECSSFPAGLAKKLGANCLGYKEDTSKLEDNSRRIDLIAS